ncbi:E3 ubiquitin/ISG15 ligase TRIM25-like [Rana temporaria]|uniref:E3 ubiquitin/ISG15 ligase TRIM25-like n=1 Tax=Rana temporaria TaxID=8407 RepID=UPI001AAD5039|nr:E3 ubiquitin/ISG15 ligase TRIM25-like [Rana temporaria]
MGSEELSMDAPAPSADSVQSRHGFLFLLSRMASADLRAELSCSICLSIFTDPVTLRCGHNFCQLCIGQVLDTQAESGAYSCPDCREGFHKRPSLHRNLALRNIAERVSSAQCDWQDSGIFCSYCIHSPVPAAKSCLLCEASLCHDHLRVHSKSEEHVLSDPTAAPGNRKCATHKKPLMYYCKKDGECVCLSCCLNGEHMGHRVDLMTEASEKKKKKLCAIMEELRASKDQTDTRVKSLHEQKKQMPKKVETLQRAVNDLSKDLKRQQDVLKKTVLNEIARQEKQNASSIDHLIQQLEIKKVELSRRLHHIEELCNVTDPVTILQNPDTEDFGDLDAENMVLPEDVYVEKDGENVAKLADAEGDLDEGIISVMLHKGLSDIMTNTRQDFRTMWESDITLDVRTASNNVHISGDQKTASWSQKSQGRQETPERFQSFKVLSSTRFPSGRHFWEVEANKIGNWRLGVAYASIDRKGDRSNIGNNDKSWGLRWCSNQLSARYDCKEISLSPKLQSNSIGIYLDYEGGELSFYDMCNPLRHLHTYKASFTEPLHVVFALWNNAWLKV